MTTKRVGIDLDGTVADFLTAAIPLLQEHYGLVPDFEKPALRIEEIFGLTVETRPAGMREFLYEGLHLFRNLPKIEEDIEQLTVQLKQMGIKVYFITARSGSRIIKEDTLFWLINNGFRFDDVFHTDEKAELCRLMRIHVMVEDEIFQALNLQKARVDVVVPNRPWNRPLPKDPDEEGRKRGRIVRVENWQQAVHAIEELVL